MSDAPLATAGQKKKKKDPIRSCAALLGVRTVGLEEGRASATDDDDDVWWAPASSWRDYPGALRVRLRKRLRVWRTRLCTRLRARFPTRPEATQWARTRLQQVTALMTKKRRKEFLGRAGPLLLVIIFVEDGARILLRWDEQLHYLTMVMKLRRDAAAACLAASSALQLTCSALVVRPQRVQPSRVTPSCLALVAHVAVQPFLYGQTADVDFLCRSVTLAGGLLLLLWGENHRQWRATATGLPLDLQGPNAHRLQLAGRLLLTFLFFFQALWAENGGLHAVLARPTLSGAVLAALLFGLSLFISIGFQTESAALALVVVFGVTNAWMYPFWSVPERLVDFYKYYFFHTLSIMGGLLLLALHGPGSFSLDRMGECKKL